MQTFVLILFAVILVIGAIVIIRDNKQDEEVVTPSTPKVTEKPVVEKKPASKKPKFNSNAVDRDNDGIVQEGTPFERPVEKKKAPAKKTTPRKPRAKKTTSTAPKTTATKAPAAKKTTSTSAKKTTSSRGRKPKSSSTKK